MTTRATKRDRAAVLETPRPLQPLAAQLTKQVQERTNRDDVVVRVLSTEHEAETPPAPAWYEPKSAQITLDMQQLKKWYDERLAKRKGKATDESLGAMLAPHVDHEFTHAVQGVLTHEAAHSQWSDWLFSERAQELHKSDPRLHNVLVTLEEPRIEHLQATTRGKPVQELLRASCQMLLADLIKELSETKDGMGGVHWPTVVALVLGREGVLLSSKEIRPITNLLELNLGDDVIDEARKILHEFRAIPDGKWQFDQLVRLGRQWLELFPSAGEGEESGGCTTTSGEPGEPGEGEAGEGSASGEAGEGSESSGEGKDGESGEGDDKSKDGKREERAGDYRHGESKIGKNLGKRLAKAIEDAATGAAGAKGEPVTMDKPAEISKAPTGAERWAEAVAASPGGGGGHGEGAEREYKTTNWSEELPRPQVRAAANRLAKDLQNLTIPERSRVTSRTELPPGRLQTRAAVAQAADRSQGRKSTATPWESVRRVRTERPQLKVGIATDVSGSIARWQRVSSELTWAATKAFHTIGAKVAAVTFGDMVEVSLSPNEPIPSKVRIREARAPYEVIANAVDALDHALRLSAPDGARLLILVTDGQIVNEPQRRQFVKQVKRLKAAGVRIVMISNEVSDVRHLPSPMNKIDIELAQFDPTREDALAKATSLIRDAYRAELEKAKAKGAA